MNFEYTVNLVILYYLIFTKKQSSIIKITKLLLITFLSIYVLYNTLFNIFSIEFLAFSAFSLIIILSFFYYFHRLNYKIYKKSIILFKNKSKFEFFFVIFFLLFHLVFAKTNQNLLSFLNIVCILIFFIDFLISETSEDKRLKFISFYLFNYCSFLMTLADVIFFLNKICNFSFQKHFVVYTITVFSTYYFFYQLRINYDKKIFGSYFKKDYIISIQNFILKTNPEISIEKVLKNLNRFLYKKLEAEFCAIYLCDPIMGEYTALNCIGLEKFLERKSYEKFINNFAEILKHQKNISSAYQNKKIKILAPIYNEKEIIAIFVAGNKKNRKFYYDNDFDLLHEIIKRTSKFCSTITKNIELKNSYWDSVRVLTNLLDARDHYTSGHSERVLYYSLLLGKKLALNARDLEILKFAGILHDIGKILIDDAILNKEETLTFEEFNLIKSHTFEGSNILDKINFLKEVKNVVKYHHERWDGTGYPDGLKGEEIPILARIIQLVDSFDAIISKRAYKEAESIAFAINEIQKCAGTQFEPKLVEEFVKLYEMGLIKKNVPSLSSIKLDEPHLFD